LKDPDYHDMKLTPEKLTAFCAALAETCNVGKACKAVEISRQTAYGWREDDPDFALAWDKAMKVGVSSLEDEAHRRGFDGNDEPVVHQGQLSYVMQPKLNKQGKPIIDRKTGMPRMVPVLDANGKAQVQTIRKYSDTLAIFLLKAHDPEKYRENSKVELTGGLNLNDMSDDELREEVQREIARLAAAGVAVPPIGGNVGND
jgi:hypothetical protein